MRENRTYGSVRGGQSNLIPSTRLTAPAALKVLRFDGPMGPRVVVGALMDTPFGREGCGGRLLNNRRRQFV